MSLYQNGILISGANQLPQMTLAEWQALPSAERPTYWICTDREYSDLPASDVTYDNTDSGLSATTVQDAIDEVAQGGGGGGSYSAGDGIDITNNEISVDTTFTEASTRTNIASGDSLSTIWGKIKKFFSDLKTVAFSGSYNDLTNKPILGNISPLDYGSEFSVEQPPQGSTQLPKLRLGNLDRIVSLNQDTTSGYNDIGVQGYRNGQPFIDSLFVPKKVSQLTNDSNYATASQIPTNNNQLTNGAGYITSAGSCAGATNSDKVDGSHAWEMQTLSSAGQTHGSSEHVLKCKYNVDGDDRFKLFTNYGVPVSVDYARSAYIYNSLKHWEGARSYSGGYSDFSTGSNILIIAVNGYANYGYNFCWARVAGYTTWRIVAYTSSGASTTTINTDIWYVNL